MHCEIGFVLRLAWVSCLPVPRITKGNDSGNAEFQEMQDCQGFPALSPAGALRNMVRRGLRGAACRLLATE